MKKTKLLSLIGIILFIAILTQIDLNATLEAFAQANVYWLAIAVIMNFFVIVPLKGLKWKVIIESQGMKFSLLESTKGFLMGFAISLLTPGRVGDLIRAGNLKEKGYNLGKAVSTVVIDRLIDVVLLFIIAVIAIAYFALFLNIEVISGVILAVLGIGLIAAIIVLSRKKLLKKVMTPFFKIFVPEKHKANFKEYFHDFYKGLGEFVRNRKFAVGSIGVGVIAWVLTLVYGIALALTLGFESNLLFITLIIPIAALLDLIPISISGFGTREAAVVFLFSFIAVSAEKAIAFSLLMFFAGYLINALLGAFFWVKSPLKIGEILGNSNKN